MTQRTQENAPEAPLGRAAALGGAFATGLIMNVMVYVLLRSVGVRMLFNALSPLIMALGLLGVAAGAFAHMRFRRPAFRRLELLLFALLIGLFFCMVFNANLSTTFLLPMNGFSLYKPDGLAWHAAAEILFFVLLPLSFILPGYYFADVFHRTDIPYAAYAAHVLGFLAGGPAGLRLVLQWGPEVGFAAALILLLAFLAKRRPVYALLFLAAAGCVAAYAPRAPRLFYTWSVREYRHLETVWSPYYKIDFISFDDDHCVSGVYNNLFMYYSCDDPMRAHLQTRQIYRELAKDKQGILVIGGSLGTAASYMVEYQDKMDYAVSVELDPVVTDRAAGAYARYSNNVLKRPDVQAVASEGRVFLENDDRKYDLIFMDGLDNRLFFAPMGLVAVENYLFTRQGFAEVVDHLKPGGLLNIDLGGITDVGYIAPFLAGLPDDVHYEVFWYVVPDYPMVGMALYFIIASRDAQALRAATEHVKSLPSVVHIAQPPPAPPWPPPTDNRPMLEAPGGGVNVATALFLAILGACGLAWRMRRRRLHGAPPSFPVLAFFMLGTLYIFAEFAVILKNAPQFPGPAYGLVMLSAWFLAGAFAANAAFVYLKRLPEKVLLLIGAACALGAAAACLGSARGLGNTPAAAGALALAAGLCTGYFWPLLLRLHPGVDRRAAFGVDSVGAFAGAFIFQLQFLNYGFSHVSALAAAGPAVLLAYVLVRRISSMTKPHLGAS